VLKDEKVDSKDDSGIPPEELPKFVAGLRKEMHKAAEALDFERAAQLRDRVKTLEETYLRV
jgi:excinuclease ABC subunit B